MKKQTFFVCEADYGGQVYFIPCQLTTWEKIIEAAKYIDKLGWEDPEGLSIYEDDLFPGTVVNGGMSGGMTYPDRLWLHGEFGPEVFKKVREIVVSE